MENNRPTVDIDSTKLYDASCALGLIARVFADWDKELCGPCHEDIVSFALGTTIMLNRGAGQDIFPAVWGSVLDVLLARSAKLSSGKQVLWPEWDPESLKHPELTRLYDLGILIAAWNLALAQDEYPPEMFLGPLFSLSGFVVEGIDRGYCLEDEKSKEIYEQHRNSLVQQFSDEESFIASMKQQLESVAFAIENYRKTMQN